MPTNLKLDDRKIAEVVKLGSFKTKQAAVSAALDEFVASRKRLLILDLAGRIDFDPTWNYKRMRSRR